MDYRPTHAAATGRLLSANDAAVLGLLANREISGYELDKLIRNTVGFFWTPVKSHVYTTLARLVEAGYATAREVEQTTRPDKRLYRITPGGEAALRRWLDESPLEPARFKNSFLLKVFLGRHMDGNALVRHIEEGRADVQEELSQLEAIERDAHPERDLYGWLALTYGLERDRATIRWADEALRALLERGGRP